MIAPGQALPRVHMMICCPGSTSLPRGKFIEIWSLRIYLNSFSFYTNCYREWISNTFTYFWCFLELFYWKFILNINNEHAQDYSCPGATFAFCSHGEKLPWQGGLPGVEQRVTRLSKLLRGNEKLMWTVTGVRPCTEAKLTPGSVSCPGEWVVPGSCEQALRISLFIWKYFGSFPHTFNICFWKTKWLTVWNFKPLTIQLLQTSASKKPNKFRRRQLMFLTT